MQVDSAPPSAPYTILRIKRKRNEEPLDALVVETRRKKSKGGGAGVFQYAQTVEPASWDTGAQQRDIQAYISRLAREPPVTPSVQIPPQTTVRPSTDEISRRYTIVEHDAPKPSTKNRFPTEPPKVVSARELEKARTSDFKMFEAVPEKKKRVKPEVDTEMDKFLPMLNEYLKIHDMDVGSKVGSAAVSPMIGTPNTDGGGSDDDYVYDVFYHRPQTLAQWNSAANVATVTGLPPQYNDEYDSPSDSEEEYDEADEDSNAEEYYKNDYPDEEAFLSDEWHDDNEDAFGCEDSNDDYDF